jgi:hypothetical protein
LALFKKNIITALLLINYSFTIAIGTAPRVQRACLDHSTGVVTVYFFAPKDACNSFKYYKLYGRDNASSPFSKLCTSHTLNITEIDTLLPNKKKWELYVSVFFACNNKDSLNSDTIFIDDQPPGNIEPDSVSVDLASQCLVAGWSKAIEPDVMGYSVFKLDPVSGKNILIDQKNTLNYPFLTSTFNTANPGNRVEISAYDSCRNEGLISNFHSPVLLVFNTGLNANYRCTRKLYINWSAYIGWATAQHDIYVWSSKTGVWKLDGTVAGNVLSYIFNIPDLNATYKFFVRAHKAAAAVSSSSNSIDIVLSDYAKPSYNFVGHVSVINETDIEITAFWDNLVPIKKVALQTKPYAGGSWVEIASPAVSVGQITFKDMGKNTGKQKYCYRLVLYNPCGIGFDTSAVHTNILLQKVAFLFSWNAYNGWAGKPYLQNLYNRSRQGFTWNSKSTWPDSTFNLADTSVPECFKAMALLPSLNGKPTDTAWSNEICLRVYDTTLIPGGFSPGGINPIFKIINPNILPGQASMKIYDRWGEKLFDGDALKGWDGKDEKDNYVGPGIFVYFIQIVRPEKRESFKGTIAVIR